MSSFDARRTIALVVGVVVLVLLAASSTLIRLYTDYLWFQEVGQKAVFVTRVTAMVATGVAFAAVALLFLGLNVYVARRLAPRRLVAVPLPDERFRSFDDLLNRVREALQPAITWALVALVGAIGVLYGLAGAANWSLVLRYLNRLPFGTADPVFAHDVGTYVFQLPLYLALQRWALGLVIVTGLITVAVHLVDGAIDLTAFGERFAPHVKAHLSVLLAFLALLVAWGYRLDRWLLLYSPRGRVVGASYTDIHAQLPAYNVLVAVSVAVAVLLFANIRVRGWALPLVGVGVWVAAAIVLGAIWPGIVQTLQVAPNELAKERPYLARNIEATSRAFGIDKVASEPFAATTKLTAKGLAEDTATVSNIRLWDPRTTAQTYAQLQEIRLYYQFLDVDVDRYVLGGDRRVVMLSARELDTDLLPSSARTWVNQHLVYTHGYGLVMSPASRVTADGLPDFLISNIPPESADPSLAVTQPAIYYGEVNDPGDRYVVVDSKVAEFDYPKGAANQYTSYAGAGGIRLSSLLRRVAFALRFGDLQFLVSTAVTPESRFMFRRNIVDRVSTLAPFLALDPDPYPALVGGRIKWIQDAYTLTQYFPYSERYEYAGEPFNYIRNSVKIVTDAYDGTMTFYVVDKTDPVLANWRRIFPTLFTDGSAMPPALRAHLRYPEQLFLAQASALEAYHMKDIGAFYAKEDLWVIPRDITGVQSADAGSAGPMVPYYVLMRLPGEPRENFIVMIPYTPNGKNNMIAWFGATGDPTDYGRLSLFAFPKQKLIFGPEQISAKINQDPIISAQLTLWNQQGSKVIRGNMLVIPIQQSIIYVQPLYLSAAQSQFPQLEKVIVAYGDRVVMENTIEGALAAVFGPAAGAEAAGAPTTQTAVPATGTASLAALIRDAQARFTAAEAAARKGDWATYGKEITALRAALERLARAAGPGR